MDRRYLPSAIVNVYRRSMTDRCILFSRAVSTCADCELKSRKLHSHCKQRSSHSANVMRRIASCDSAHRALLLTDGDCCARARLWISCAPLDEQRNATRREATQRVAENERERNVASVVRINHKRNTAPNGQSDETRETAHNPEIIIVHPVYNAHFPFASIIFFPAFPRRT